MTDLHICRASLGVPRKMLPRKPGVAVGPIAKMYLCFFPPACCARVPRWPSPVCSVWPMRRDAQTLGLRARIRVRKFK